MRLLPILHILLLQAVCADEHGDRAGVLAGAGPARRGAQAGGIRTAPGHSYTIFTALVKP